MPGAPVQQEEHKELRRTIEESCVIAATAAVDVQTWFQEKRGALAIPFTTFYKAFSLLITLTAGMKEMSAKDEVVKEALEWKQPRTLYEQRALKGVELFDKYYKALNDTGLVTMRR